MEDSTDQKARFVLHSPGQLSFKEMRELRRHFEDFHDCVMRNAFWVLDRKYDNEWVGVCVYNENIMMNGHYRFDVPVMRFSYDEAGRMMIEELLRRREAQNIEWVVVKCRQEIRNLLMNEFKFIEEDENPFNCIKHYTVCRHFCPIRRQKPA